MARVVEQRQIPAAADLVWEIVGDFSRAGEWCSGIMSIKTNGSEVGAIREVEIGAASPIIERLESYDAKSRRLTYSVLSGPLPVDGYVAEIRVVDSGYDTSVVTYSADYLPARLPADKCERMFHRAFAQSLSNLKRHFAQTPAGPLFGII